MANRIRNILMKLIERKSGIKTIVKYIASSPKNMQDAIVLFKRNSTLSISKTTHEESQELLIIYLDLHRQMQLYMNELRERQTHVQLDEEEKLFLIDLQSNIKQIDNIISQLSQNIRNKNRYSFMNISDNLKNIFNSKNTQSKHSQKTVDTSGEVNLVSFLVKYFSYNPKIFKATFEKAMNNITIMNYGSVREDLQKLLIQYLNLHGQIQFFMTELHNRQISRSLSEDEVALLASLQTCSKQTENYIHKLSHYLGNKKERSITIFPQNLKDIVNFTHLSTMSQEILRTNRFRFTSNTHSNKNSNSTVHSPGQFSKYFESISTKIRPFFGILKDLMASRILRYIYQLATHSNTIRKKVNQSDSEDDKAKKVSHENLNCDDQINSEDEPDDFSSRINTQMNSDAFESLTENMVASTIIIFTMLQSISKSILNYDTYKQEDLQSQVTQTGRENLEVSEAEFSDQSELLEHEYDRILDDQTRVKQGISDILKQATRELSPYMASGNGMKIVERASDMFAVSATIKIISEKIPEYVNEYFTRRMTEEIESEMRKYIEELERIKLQALDAKLELSECFLSLENRLLELPSVYARKTVDMIRNSGADVLNMSNIKSDMIQSKDIIEGLALDFKNSYSESHSHLKMFLLFYQLAFEFGKTANEIPKIPRKLMVSVACLPCQSREILLQNSKAATLEASQIIDQIKECVN